jgi:manganese-dependent ADP-ribose/CDP-alcohol diphosphatase
LCLDAEKNSYDGLQGDNKRFVAFNGAIGEEQLKWMEKELEDAVQKNQKVHFFVI